MSKSSSTNNGIGLFGFVFLVFLALKLAGIGQVATWSWWWVTSPLWIPFAVIIAVLIIFGFLFLLAFIFSGGKVTIEQGNKTETTKMSISNFQKRLKDMAEQRRKNNLSGEN